MNGEFGAASKAESEMVGDGGLWCSACMQHAASSQAFCVRTLTLEAEDTGLTWSCSLVRLACSQYTSKGLIFFYCSRCLTGFGGPSRLPGQKKGQNETIKRKSRGLLRQCSSRSEGGSGCEVAIQPARAPKCLLYAFLCMICVLCLCAVVVLRMLWSLCRERLRGWEYVLCTRGVRGQRRNDDSRSEPKRA